MISIRQIRAARGLLDWSQTDLAVRANVSQRAITSIETGKNRPSFTTLSTIENIFIENGIEFIEGGVKLKNPTITIISGDNVPQKFLNFLYKRLKDENISEVLANGLNQALLSEEVKKGVINYLENIKSIGVSERVLVSEDFDINCALGGLERYRGVPCQFFSDTSPLFIFGNYYALMMLDIQEIVVVENAPMANFQRKIFEMMWVSGKEFKM